MARSAEIKAGWSEDTSLEPDDSPPATVDDVECARCAECDAPLTTDPDSPCPDRECPSNVPASLVEPTRKQVEAVAAVAAHVAAASTAEFTGRRLMTMKPSKRGGWCALCDREISVAESYYAGNGKRRAHSACVAAARSLSLPGVGVVVQ
jgi:hypothetical protein